MENPEKSSQETINPIFDKERQDEVMNDVFILLENLINREENTVKLIVGSLYDIGTVNIINQKFKSRTFNKILKRISLVSKPAFTVIIWRWAKKNLPQLIANWCEKKVSFDPDNSQTKKMELAAIQQDISPTAIPPLKYKIQDVRYLRFQVNLLTNLLGIYVIGSLTLVSGGLLWLSHEMQQSRQQTIQEIQTQIKILEANRNP